MLPSILDHLDRLQAELAALDPEGEIAAADRVAAMAAALREAAGAMGRRGEPAPQRVAAASNC